MVIINNYHLYLPLLLLLFYLNNKINADNVINSVILIDRDKINKNVIYCDNKSL